MKQKIIYIVIIIIVLSVLFVLFRPIKNSGPEKQIKTESTYIPGNTQQLHKQGKDSITTKTKSLHKKVILRSSAEDSSYTFTKAPAAAWSYQDGDSSYNLSINIKPAEDGNLSMDYFLDLTSKELIRIDTIYQLRIDTLKIKQTITERIEQPFYNTFLFGVIVTGAVILLIIHFIQ
ncbi:MAG: hypothetical protein ACYDA4_08530 [Ignavibacteriaceae bacterium]